MRSSNDDCVCAESFAIVYLSIFLLRGALMVSIACAEVVRLRAGRMVTIASACVVRNRAASMTSTLPAPVMDALISANNEPIKDNTPETTLFIVLLIAPLEVSVPDKTLPLSRDKLAAGVIIPANDLSVLRINAPALVSAPDKTLPASRANTPLRESIPVNALPIALLTAPLVVNVPAKLFALSRINTPARDSVPPISFRNVRMLVKVPAGLVVGVHTVSVVATTSNADLSPEVRLVIRVDY